MLLLSAQQLGVAHLTAHAVERLKDHQGTSQTDDGSCAKCAAYASLGSAPPASSTVFAHVVVRVPLAIAAASPAGSRTVPVYQSRAPPLPL